MKGMRTHTVVAIAVTILLVAYSYFTGDIFFSIGTFAGLSMVYLLRLIDITASRTQKQTATTPPKSSP